MATKKIKKTAVVMATNPSCFGEMLGMIADCNKQEIEIVETIQLKWSKFLEFADHLDKPYDWLIGKTGAVYIIPPYGRYRGIHLVVVADKQGIPVFAGIKIKE
jgi:hypothetical protein